MSRSERDSETNYDESDSCSDYAADSGFMNIDEGLEDGSAVDTELSEFDQSI